jgi:hypothetical protein
VKLLRKAEDGIGNGEKGKHAGRPYCKAYLLSDLRRFPAWPVDAGGVNSKGAGGDGAETSAGEEIVYLHQDFTVTQSIWHGEDVVFAEVTPEWKEFCSDVLKFKVPDDLDLLVSADNVGGDLKLGSVN